MQQCARIGLVVALALALGLSATARAQEKASATGTWKWSFMTGGGQSIEQSAKLKQDGEKLTGTYIGRDGKEVPIEEGKVKGGEVSFQVPREFGGQKFIIKYTGKLSGDTIKGKAAADFGGESKSFDWEAKRQK
jgi:hypothetical protein